MTASVVQAKNFIGEGATVTGTLAGAPTNGHLLIALVYSHHGSGTMDPVAAGWNDTFPFGSAFNWIWANTDTWGSARCFYKWCLGETAVTTPITAGSNVVWAMTVYEVANLDATWDEAFRIDDASAPEETTGGLQLYGSLSDTNSFLWEAGSDSSVLVLAQAVFFKTQAYPTLTGFANATTGANATTTQDWPLGSGTKAGSCIGYYDTISASGSKTLLLSNPPTVVGSVAIIGLKASLSTGGGGLTSITTTVISAAVGPAIFRYTTIS